MPKLQACRMAFKRSFTASGFSEQRSRRTRIAPGPISDSGMSRKKSGELAPNRFVKCPFKDSAPNQLAGQGAPLEMPWLVPVRLLLR